MRALVVTITKEDWPSGLARHWHIVDNHISRHLVGAVQVVYGRFAEVEEFTWDDDIPICPRCDEPIKH